MPDLLRLAPRLGGVVLLALCAACGGPTPTPVPIKPALVREIHGQAFVCRDSFPADLTTCPRAAVGGEVVVNGGAHTGPGDSTLLLQTTGARFLLTPESSLRYVESSNIGISFLLAAGRLFADHEPGTNTIIVRSRNTLVTSLDTRFTIQADSGDVVVSVDSGDVTVEVPPGSGHTMRMTAGQGMHIAATASAPPAPQAQQPDEIRLWREIGNRLFPQTAP